MPYFYPRSLGANYLVGTNQLLVVIMTEYQLLVSIFLVSSKFVLFFPNMYCSMIRKLICLHFLDLMSGCY